MHFFLLLARRVSRLGVGLKGGLGGEQNLGNAIKKALLTGTFFKIGVPNRKWVSFSRVKMVSQENRPKWLRSVETRLERL